MNIRPERAEDTAAIRKILVSAFPSAAEADLVERLRGDGDLALALVAEENAVACGYVSFPRLAVDEGTLIHDAAGLAPVAVTPERQRRGIGGVLIREGHRLLHERGTSLIFVLGDPGYYARFGYDLDTAAPFSSVYAGPYFMALRLSETAPRAGEVRYPAAFDQLS